MRVMMPYGIGQKQWNGMAILARYIEIEEIFQTRS